MTLPIDVARHLRAHFPPDEHGTALGSLNTAVLHDGTKRDARMLRGAALTSAGDPRKQERYADDLRIDARNVGAKGEHELIEGRLVRVRNLVEPIPPSE